MVPRDEDGEKLARKRAKQRAVPPTMSRFANAPAGDAASFLSSLAIQLPGAHRSQEMELPSPRSTTSSPVSPIFHDDASYADTSPDNDDPMADISAATAPAGTPAAQVQAQNEASLFRLALDEEGGKGRQLQSAMFYAAVHSPSDSPSKRVATSKLKRPVELEMEDDEGELKAVFAAHIAAKLLELDAPPAPQPNPEQIHEEFLLLNHEHRRRYESCAQPIVAF
jgi:hypothetical protein